MRISNETVLRKAWLESWNVETLAFPLSTRPVIPIAEGQQTGLALFILDKPILADILLCLPDIVFSFFSIKIFSEKISFGQLIISHLHSTLFKVIQSLHSPFSHLQSTLFALCSFAEVASL